MQIIIKITIDIHMHIFIHFELSSIKSLFNSNADERGLLEAVGAFKAT